MSDFAIDLDKEDIIFDGLDFVQDDGLRSAVYISLFTDRRAEEEEIETGQDPRGTWSDHYEDEPSGSKLWLLRRKKQIDSTLRLSEEYALESLNWLIKSGVAKNTSATAEWVRNGLLGMSIKIHKPGQDVEFKFSLNWEAEQANGI